MELPFGKTLWRLLERKWWIPRMGKRASWFSLLTRMSRPIKWIFMHGNCHLRTLTKKVCRDFTDCGLFEPDLCTCMNFRRSQEARSLMHHLLVAPIERTSCKQGTQGEDTSWISGVSGEGYWFHCPLTLWHWVDIISLVTKRILPRIVT